MKGEIRKQITVVFKILTVSVEKKIIQRKSILKTIYGEQKQLSCHKSLKNAF